MSYMYIRLLWIMCFEFCGVPRVSEMPLYMYVIALLKQLCARFSTVVDEMFLTVPGAECFFFQGSGPVSPTPTSPPTSISPIPISPSPVSPTLDIQCIPVSPTLHFLSANVFFFFFFFFFYNLIIIYFYSACFIVNIHVSM